MIFSTLILTPWQWLMVIVNTYYLRNFRDVHERLVSFNSTNEKNEASGGC